MKKILCSLMVCFGLSSSLFAMDQIIHTDLTKAGKVYTYCKNGLQYTIFGNTIVQDLNSRGKPMECPSISIYKREITLEESNRDKI